MMNREEKATGYGIRPVSPPLSEADAIELETNEDQLEVVVSWGRYQVLEVAHVPLDGSFVIGEDGSGDVDFLAGADTLGFGRVALVQGGRLVPPAGAELSVVRDGETVQTPSLAPGETCTVTIGELRFVVRRVRAGKKAERKAIAVERQPLFFVGGVMAVAGFLLALFAMMPPSGSALALDHLDRDSRLVQFLTQPPVTEDDLFVETATEDPGGTEGEAHAGDEGEMGDRDAPDADSAYSVAGPRDNQDEHLANQVAPDQVRTAGILGTLQSAIGAMDSPTSPFGRDTALGSDAESFLGHLMGANLGAASGNGGLGLRGTGRGAGGDGLGTIGAGEYGTLGHGCRGGDCSEGTRYGSGVGNEMGRQGRTPPRMTVGNVEAIGSLSKEAIRRVIHRHRNEVKFCYEQGLQSRPDLEGRVSMRFMIAPSGAVQFAGVQSSSLNNQRVEGCVTSAVRRWTFPQPEGGGSVMVTYPFSLIPSH